MGLAKPGKGYTLSGFYIRVIREIRVINFITSLKFKT